MLWFSARRVSRKKQLTRPPISSSSNLRRTALSAKFWSAKARRFGKNAGIVEIEIGSETQTAAVDKKNNKSGGVNLQAIETEIRNAENEVERTSVEVERVQSLIASNSVPQAQLDAARADFQRAQEFLQNVREKKKNQETALLIERSRGETVTSENISDNKIVVVRTSEAGILKVLNARVGQRVKTGQILATVSTN